MSLKLDGNSEIGAHLYLICLSNLIRSRVVTNLLFFFLWKGIFSFMRPCYDLPPNISKKKYTAMQSMVHHHQQVKIWFFLWCLFIKLLSLWCYEEPGKTKHNASPAKILKLFATFFSLSKTRSMYFKNKDKLSINSARDNKKKRETGRWRVTERKGRSMCIGIKWQNNRKLL